MTLEVERKFLLSELPADVEKHPAHELLQGYLVTTPEGLEVRVRATDGVPVLTIKSAGSLTRIEVEVPIGDEQFAALQHPQLSAPRHEPSALTLASRSALT